MERMQERLSYWKFRYVVHVWLASYVTVVRLLRPLNGEVLIKNFRASFDSMLSSNILYTSEESVLHKELRPSQIIKKVRQMSRKPVMLSAPSPTNVVRKEFYQVVFLPNWTWLQTCWMLAKLARPVWKNSYRTEWLIKPFACIIISNRRS